MFAKDSYYKLNRANPRVRKSNFIIIINRDKIVLQKQFIYYVLSRVIFMAIALCLSGIVLPYYTFDDLNFYSKVTLEKIDPMFYLRQRQSWTVLCAILNSVWIFRMIQLPRIINTFVGWMVIKELCHTMELMKFEERVIKKAANFIIFFPVYIFFTCSLVKEIVFILNTD